MALNICFLCPRCPSHRHLHRRSLSSRWSLLTWANLSNHLIRNCSRPIHSVLLHPFICIHSTYHFIQEVLYQSSFPLLGTRWFSYKLFWSNKTPSNSFHSARITKTWLGQFLKKGKDLTTQSYLWIDTKILNAIHIFTPGNVYSIF